MDWDKLRTFHTAAQVGSLTGAAERLGLSQSAVSRQIAALEKQLGAALFHRHARGLRPTEQGRILQEAAQDVSTRLARAETALMDARDAPAGRITLSAPVAFGSRWLAPRLKRFIDAYPEIDLVLDLTDAETSFAPEEVQCAVRLWRPREPDVIARPLMNVTQALYASPAYLARRGAPQTPEDLDGHDIIAYHATRPSPMQDLEWPLRLGRGSTPRQGAMSVTSILGVLGAVSAGLGVGGLPDYLARDDADLVRVIPEATGPAFEAFFVYPASLRGSRRIAALRDDLLTMVRAASR